VLSFLYADLIVLPLLDVYRRYYGWRMAAYIAAVFYVTMVLAGLIMDVTFTAAGLVPEPNPNITRPVTITKRHRPGSASDLLTDHRPMAVGRSDGHLAHAPGPVNRRLLDDGASPDEFRVQRIDIVDVQISKITMVAGLRRKHRIGTMADHHSDAAARKRLPVRAIPPVPTEAERLFEIVDRAPQIGHGENEGISPQSGAFRHKRSLHRPKDS
jgi:hypothetical protein